MSSTSGHNPQLSEDFRAACRGVVQVFIRAPQEQVDRFNTENPIGTPVRVVADDCTLFDTFTTAPAFVHKNIAPAVAVRRKGLKPLKKEELFSLDRVWPIKTRLVHVEAEDRY